MLVLLVGLLGSRWVRAQLVPALALVALGAALGLTIWQWNADKSIVAGALRIDDLSLALNLILITGGMCTVLLAWRSLAARESAHGEFHALLLTSVSGMTLLASAQNTVALFIGLELLSIPLYVLCATELQARAVAGVRAEVPDHRLGGLGDAAVWARADLRCDRRD